MKRYFFNILVLLDIALNVFFLGGSPFETISSRIGKRRLDGDRWACWLCKRLDKIDPRHCDKSILPDIGVNAPNWWKFKR